MILSMGAGLQKCTLLWGNIKGGNIMGCDAAFSDVV
jgi:hypothetical protein